MTDKELAEEYVRVNCDDSLNSFRGQELIQTYLAGLKAGREERMKEILKEYPDFGKGVGYKMSMVDELEKESCK